jgi:hypothetical protein
MSLTTPAKHWRSMMMQIAYMGDRPNNMSEDDYFLEKSEQEHNASHQELERILAEGGDPTGRGVRNGIYLSAIALLTYGRIDVVGDILNNLPPQFTNMYQLHRVVDALIPVPSSLRTIQDKDAVMTWVRDNIDNLKWNDEKGKFILHSLFQNSVNNES